MINCIFDVKNSIKSFDIINKTKLEQTIGVCNGFDGITSRDHHRDVILYNKGFIDLFEALRLLCEANVFNINGKLSRRCNDFYQYIISTKTFFPILLTISPHDRNNEQKYHFYYDMLSGNNEELLRELLLIFEECINSILSLEHSTKCSLADLKSERSVIKRGNREDIFLMYKGKLRKESLLSDFRKTLKKIMKSGNELSNRLDVIEELIEIFTTELQHLDECKECLISCTEYVVNYLEVGIFDILDLVLYIQKALVKPVEKVEEDAK